MTPEHPETPPADRSVNASAPPPWSLAGKAAVVAAVALGLAALLFLAWEGAKVLLLAFAGVLVGVLLRAVSTWLRDRLGSSYRVAYAVTLVLIVVLLVVSVLYLAPRIDRQVGQLAEDLPQALDRLDERMESYGWYRWLEGVTPSPEEMASNAANASADTAEGGSQGAGESGEGESDDSGGNSLFQGALRWLKIGVGGIVNAVVILFVGLYFGAQPHLYRRGFLRLVPLARRERADEVLDATHRALEHWLLGKLIAMVIIGVASTIGLMILGIPLALTFGILAGLLSFIPNFGPVLSALPPMLLALATSPQKALWVAVLYMGIQAVESYLITPMIQHRAVDLPPVAIILAQIFLGVLFGFLGLLVATPLMAVVLVLVQKLYVEDALGDDLDEPPEGSDLAAAEG